MPDLEPRFILDTHVLVRGVSDRKKLSIDQERILRRCESRRELIALSDMSLLEVAMVFSSGRQRIKVSLSSLFGAIDTNPIFQIVPISTAIAAEAARLPPLWDPADRVIVATAHVHRLTLLTSDQRILDSGLVPTIS